MARRVYKKGFDKAFIKSRQLLNHTLSFGISHIGELKDILILGGVGTALYFNSIP